MCLSAALQDAAIWIKYEPLVASPITSRAMRRHMENSCRQCNLRSCQFSDEIENLVHIYARQPRCSASLATPIGTSGSENDKSHCFAVSAKSSPVGA